MSPPSASVFLKSFVSLKKEEPPNSRILPCGPILLQLHKYIATAVIIFELGIHKCSQVSYAVGFCLFDLRHG